jgi:hypothetical protein
MMPSTLLFTDSLQEDQEDQEDQEAQEAQEAQPDQEDLEAQEGDNPFNHQQPNLYQSPRPQILELWESALEYSTETDRWQMPSTENLQVICESMKEYPDSNHP